MRFSILLASLLLACNPVGGSQPPVVAAQNGGIVVSGQQTISVDMSLVPLVTACPSGFVRRAANGFAWECADLSGDGGVVVQGASLSLDPSVARASCGAGKILARAADATGWDCLDTVPSAVNATFAADAGSAVTAANAVNAANLGGAPASAYLKVDGSNSVSAPGDVQVAGRVVLSANGKQISVDGLYCGQTQTSTQGRITATPPTGPALVGYAAAKVICEGVCGKPYAHLCTVGELVRSAQLGLTVPAGWAASGLDVSFGGSNMTDCAGFTCNDSTGNCGYASDFAGSPSSDVCTLSRPINCCQ